MSDRSSELRWRWRLLVLDVVVYTANLVNILVSDLCESSGSQKKSLTDQVIDLEARAQRLRKEVETS
jgi:hypothetical protein